MKKILSSAALMGLLFMAPPIAHAQNEDMIVDITFPVAGEHTFTDNFGDPRWKHSHEAIDIMAEKMTPVLAAQSGRVSFAPNPEPSYGWGIWIDGDDGYIYAYIHLNNDTPGTDDGNGGVEYAYAPGIERGARVERGQLIGWVGDSGNAENIGSHLHFEIRLADDTPINPYKSLLAALEVGEVNYNPEQEKALSPNINSDLKVEPTAGASACESGSLIKSPSTTSVYYCGSNGKRYVFPNSGTYFTWYEDFSEVTTISEEALASIPLGGNVSCRPGVKLVKIQSDPKVYAVGHGGVLRWVSSPLIAQKLYGDNWAKQIDDIAETFFINYTVGEPVEES